MVRRTINGRRVAESTRERETFKYDPTLLTNVIYNDAGLPRPNTELKTSNDAVLSSIASLATLRTNTTLSFISLFDQRWSYIVAEASPKLRPRPNLKYDERHDTQIWLCGTAIPRSHSVCEAVLTSQNPEDFVDLGKNEGDLPLCLINDLTVDARFCMRPYCSPGSQARFYAAVPIRSNRGINIGTFCVLDETPGPRPEWDNGCTEVMRDLSRNIIDYLELRRSRNENIRKARMTRGVESFVEGKATTFPGLYRIKDPLAGEEKLDSNQRSIEPQRCKEAQKTSDDYPNFDEVPFNVHNSVPSGIDQGSQTYRPGLGKRTPSTTSSGEQTVEEIFSKAANIIREAIEVEVSLFLDASVKSFGALNEPPVTDEPSEYKSASFLSDSDEAKSAESSPELAIPCCSVLGFSTSESSSIDDAASVARYENVAEKLLSALIRRYPRGHIFSFDKNGCLESGDFSGSDSEPILNFPVQIQTEKPRHKRCRNPWTQQTEAAGVSRIFPRARSVAFMPVWDGKKDRCYAGCLVFTCNPARILTEEGELSYLRAFGMLAISETQRLEVILANKAKSDVLSSLSHELRSPLHGVVLGVELLHDTQLDVFQGDVLHTLETCGRTLLDTVDHLLDFAKINNFISSKKERKRGVRGLRDHECVSIEAGMKSLYTDIRLDVLIEEVMESVFASFNFQHLSVAQLASRNGHQTGREKTQLLDSMKAMDEFGLEQKKHQQQNVSIYLDVDPEYSWLFHATPGAIRRVLMNLFGNSLKYTSEGTIRVSLTQNSKPSRGKHQLVKMTVADTGKGISEDFLRHELFKPFSQEDTLSPGTGLGLSLVKQITSSLGGKIAVKSSLEHGTTITVALPLKHVESVPNSCADATLDTDKDFFSQVEQLKGLRIRLIGFNRCTTERGKNSEDHGFDDYTLIEKICQSWLGMQVVSQGHDQELVPDLVLCVESILGNLKLPSRPPTVVICTNALVAYHRATSSKTSGVFEFISQPTGPRKLAKSLLLAFKRWVEGQALVTPDEVSRTLSTASGSESVPTCAGPGEIVATFGPLKTRPPSPPHQNVKLPIITKPSEEPKEDVPLPNGETEFLLVDDNPINVKMLVSYMKKLKRNYKTATNGQEAVHIYWSDPNRYRCVFMDINMPVMDGFEATRQIRALEREQGSKPTSIFALSGLASAEAQQEAFGSGIDLFLTKPVKLKELNSILTTRGLL